MTQADVVVEQAQKLYRDAITYTGGKQPPGWALGGPFNEGNDHAAIFAIKWALERDYLASPPAGGLRAAERQRLRLHCPQRTEFNALRDCRVICSCGEIFEGIDTYEAKDEWAKHALAAALSAPPPSPEQSLSEESHEQGIRGPNVRDCQHVDQRGILDAVSAANMVEEGSSPSPRVPPSPEGERYGANRFDLAAPGDRQKQRWILRFDDADRREMHFTDEAEAWAAWNQFSPSWNCYLFNIAALGKVSRADIYEECARIADNWNPGRRDRITEEGIAEAIRELAGKVSREGEG